MARTSRHWVCLRAIALVLAATGSWMIHQITLFAVYAIRLIPSLG